MDMQQQKPFLESLAKGISSLFGRDCEVTVHDLTDGFENTIIIIENGHVTGRKVGDGASEKVLAAIKSGGDNIQDQYDYLARTKSGRVLKSSSIYLRDENGKLIGLFGINYDITDMMMAKKAIDNAVSVGSDAQDQSGMGTITANVTDLLDQLVEESLNFVGKPVALMTKEDKIKAIQYLDGKGAFLIKKSGDKISKFYDISKYTLYNYMDADAQER